MDQPNRIPVPFPQVTITDAFWAPRQAANRDHGLWAVYQQLQATGRIAAYNLDWQPGSDQPQPHVFWDSDVAKWLEGACYSLITHPDPALKAEVEHVVDRILSAQQPDGGINPYFTVVAPQDRWTNLRDRHELYCAGHLIEAAIAHHQATGDPRFLHAIRRYADLIDRKFGPDDDQIHGYPGHEELEFALIKLYRHTGEKHYLEKARYFIEERGREPHYFDLEARARGEAENRPAPRPLEYWQAHKPVREQTEVVGHAVRAMYMYSAMADLAYETQDPSLLVTLRTLWHDLTSKKMYLTGGIGSSGSNEGFTQAYHLPNHDAYAETCAAIGLIFWAQRMLQLDLQSTYADVMERALYNGMLSGISLHGDRFFYENPLASHGDHHRQAFFKCSCCPPNLNRILPAVGGLMYSQTSQEIVAHLYIGSAATFNLEGGQVTLIQETDYPWDGVVCMRFKMNQPLNFTLKLRYPGWCQEARLYLNGEAISIGDHLEQGYICLDRQWAPGDEVRLQFVMAVTRVYAHPMVKANLGRVALMRGPLVYCLEEADHLVPLAAIRLPREAGFDCQFNPDLLDGVITIQATANAVDLSGEGQPLYQPTPPRTQPVKMTAIPYYAWDNRAPGEMRVWLLEDCLPH